MGEICSDTNPPSSDILLIVGLDSLAPPDLGSFDLDLTEDGGVSPRGTNPGSGSGNLGTICVGAGDSGRLVGYRALVPLPVSGIAGGRCSDIPVDLSAVE